jgi:hypothetical protein
VKHEPSELGSGCPNVASPRDDSRGSQGTPAEMLSSVR